MLMGVGLFFKRRWVVLSLFFFVVGKGGDAMWESPEGRIAAARARSKVSGRGGSSALMKIFFTFFLSCRGNEISGHLGPVSSHPSSSPVSTLSSSGWVRRGETN